MVLAKNRNPGRWGDDAPDNSDAARERLIDAAERCFGRYGPAKTTIEDVAAEAQVSRATVYRYFEGRDDVILGVLMRAAHQFLARLRDVIPRQISIEDSIVESVLFTVEAVRADEHLAALFTPETAGHTLSVAGASPALIETVQEMLSPVLGPAIDQGLLRSDVSVDDAAEWLVRIVHSVLTVESKHRTEGEWRQYLRTFLVPSLVVRDPSAASTRS